MLRVAVEEIKDGITISNESFEVSDAKCKAFDSRVISKFEWIKGAVKGIVRVAMCRIIQANSDKDPQKLIKDNPIEAENIVTNATVETGVEKNARLLDELNNG